MANVCNGGNDDDSIDRAPAEADAEECCSRISMLVQLGTENGRVLDPSDGNVLSDVFEQSDDSATEDPLAEMSENEYGAAFILFLRWGC